MRCGVGSAVHWIGPHHRSLFLAEDEALSRFEIGQDRGHLIDGKLHALRDRRRRHGTSVFRQPSDHGRMDRPMLGRQGADLCLGPRRQLPNSFLSDCRRKPENVPPTPAIIQSFTMRRLLGTGIGGASSEATRNVGADGGPQPPERTALAGLGHSRPLAYGVRVPIRRAPWVVGGWAVDLLLPATIRVSRSPG